MRALCGVSVVILALTGCGDTGASPAPTSGVAISAPAPTTSTILSPATVATVDDGYRLAWSDDFEGAADRPPDPAWWNHELGGEGWGNRELQYYTDRPENAALDGNGHLAITARAGAAPGDARCWYGPCEYTSARLTTEAKVEPEYGKVEARVRIPSGQGIWSAFWMLGNNIRVRPWPVSGEIDVMENVGHEPKTVHGSAHGPGYSGGEPLGGSISLSPGDLSDDFHVYSVEWAPESIAWRVDGRLYAQATPEDVPAGGYWVFDHPFFLILNVAVGGNWPGSPDATTEFPQTMLVDWVRVWEPAGD